MSKVTVYKGNNEFNLNKESYNPLGEAANTLKEQLKEPKKGYKTKKYGFLALGIAVVSGLIQTFTSEEFDIKQAGLYLAAGSSLLYNSITNHSKLKEMNEKLEILRDADAKYKCIDDNTIKVKSEKSKKSFRVNFNEKSKNQFNDSITQDKYTKFL